MLRVINTRVAFGSSVGCPPDCFFVRPDNTCVKKAVVVEEVTYVLSSDGTLALSSRLDSIDVVDILFPHSFELRALPPHMFGGVAASISFARVRRNQPSCVEPVSSPDRT
jgi:hypothetical protein